MDDFDPARVIMVEAIATMENAIEALIPAQAPGSTRGDIRQGTDRLCAVAKRLLEHAQAVEPVLGHSDRDDS